VWTLNCYFDPDVGLVVSRKERCGKYCSLDVVFLMLLNVLANAGGLGIAQDSDLKKRKL